jgi:hypothetical protein
MYYTTIFGFKNCHPWKWRDKSTAHDVKKKSSMTCPDKGFPHMRNKDSGARTGLAPAIPTRCLFYPNFSTVCVEGGGLPNSSLTGPVQSPGRATPTTRRLKQTSVPVTPRLVVWYRGLVGGRLLLSWCRSFFSDQNMLQFPFQKGHHILNN